MPIYEYLCNSCEETFEMLIRDGDSMMARCPSCGAAEVSRLLSMFATTGLASASREAQGHSGAGHACGCGGCTCSGH